MLKRLALLTIVIGTLSVPFGLTPAATAGEEPAEDLVCDNSRNHPYTGTYANVIVPEGASCYLRGAVVTGNLNALHGAINVFVVNTEVQRNIHIRRAERNVKIGPPRCRFDPLVGNNIKVVRSHNVAICWMSVGNNIRVSRNDGRIFLANNNAGSNILVTDNLPYNRKPGDGRHRLIHAIRLRHNTAGQQILVTRNPNRPLLLHNNTPEVVT